MTTEEVYVKNDGTGFDAVESSVDSVIEKIGCPVRSFLHIKLLTEEMLGMENYDDVQVGIMKDKVELIITKRFV